MLHALYTLQAKNSGMLLLNLINDIFDIARIEAGQLRLETSDFTLFSTLEETAAIVTAKAAEKELALQLEIDEPLRDMNYVGDIKRIQQARRRQPCSCVTGV